MGIRVSLKDRTGRSSPNQFATCLIACLATYIAMVSSMFISPPLKGHFALNSNSPLYRQLTVQYGSKCCYDNIPYQEVYFKRQFLLKQDIDGVFYLISLKFLTFLNIREPYIYEVVVGRVDGSISCVLNMFVVFLCVVIILTW